LEQMTCSVLDRAAAMDRLGLEEELLDEFIHSLVERSRGMVGEMRQALADADLKRTEELSHSIKGAAATFEANSLAEAARRMEALARAGDLAGCNRSWADLALAVDQLAAAV
jgi:HPt (histidine-containing phosphotransfer) domain-containing protein